MSKTYKKLHRLDKAAKNHAAKIRKRGGKVTVTKRKGFGTVLNYKF